MRILHLNSFLLAALLIAQSAASAAVVTLKNGDRVTGEVIESNDAKLRVNTEFLGEVEISWEAVSGIDSDDPLHVSSSDGQVLVGPLTTQGDSFQVKTANSFNERLTFYPNLTTGEYRLQFDTGLVTDVFRWMSWNVTFSDRFLSNPVNGREQNDVLLTTGVRLVFGKEKLR